MIRDEFLYAKANGWLAYFEAAGQKYGFPAALLMGLASRETNMRNIVGDEGHGYGLCQIDIRSFPDFCHSGAWRNASLAIHTGAQVLDMKRTQCEHLQKTYFVVGGFHCIGPELTEESLLRCSVAAYNCGLWALYSQVKYNDPDRFTTGRNYSKDVLQRQTEFEALLKGAENEPK